MSDKQSTGKDSDDRAYASFKALAVGDVLEADAGFITDPETNDGKTHCIEPGAKLTVQQDDKGFYVPCTAGKHHVDGQRGTFDGKHPDALVGFYPLAAEQPHAT